jgi:hypothetical protein
MPIARRTFLLAAATLGLSSTARGLHLEFHFGFDPRLGESKGEYDQPGNDDLNWDEDPIYDSWVAEQFYHDNDGDGSTSRAPRLCGNDLTLLQLLGTETETPATSLEVPPGAYCKSDSLRPFLANAPSTLDSAIDTIKMLGSRFHERADEIIDAAMGGVVDAFRSSAEDKWFGVPASNTFTDTKYCGIEGINQGTERFGNEDPSLRAMFSSTRSWWKYPLQDHAGPSFEAYRGPYVQVGFNVEDYCSEFNCPLADAPFFYPDPSAPPSDLSEEPFPRPIPRGWTGEPQYGRGAMPPDWRAISGRALLGD